MYGIYANIWGILMVNVTIYMDPMGNIYIYMLLESYMKSPVGSTRPSGGAGGIECSCDATLQGVERDACGAPSSQEEKTSYGQGASSGTTMVNL